MKQHIGSHNSRAVPDQKMGRNAYPWSAMKKTVKHIAAKKRRQRDRKVAEQNVS